MISYYLVSFRNTCYTLQVLTPPPFFLGGGTPKLHKEGKNVARVLVLNSYPGPPFLKSSIRPCCDALFEMLTMAWNEYYTLHRLAFI